MFRHVLASDGRRMRWANGMGVTTEIAVFPADAGLDDFHWRVSVARMTADAAFSPLPGIDRTLVVVDGVGLDLAVGSGGLRRLGLNSEPFRFPGDVPAFGRLVNGPVSNFNVMTDRRTGDHQVERVRVNGTFTLWTTGSTIIYALGALTANEVDMAPGDTAIVGDPPTCLQLEGQEANALLARISSVADG